MLGRDSRSRRSPLIVRCYNEHLWTCRGADSVRDGPGTSREPAAGRGAWGPPSRALPCRGGKPGPAAGSLRRGPVSALPAQGAASLAEKCDGPLDSAAGASAALRSHRAGPLRPDVSLEHTRSAFSAAGSLPGPRGGHSYTGRALSHLPDYAVSPPPQSLPLPAPRCLPLHSRPCRLRLPGSPRPFTLLAVAVISSPSPWPRDACLAAYPTFKGIPRKLRVLMLL